MQNLARKLEAAGGQIEKLGFSTGAGEDNHHFAVARKGNGLEFRYDSLWLRLSDFQLVPATWTGHSASAVQYGARRCYYQADVRWKLGSQHGEVAGVVLGSSEARDPLIIQLPNVSGLRHIINNLLFRVEHVLRDNFLDKLFE